MFGSEHKDALFCCASFAAKPLKTARKKAALPWLEERPCSGTRLAGVWGASRCDIITAPRKFRSRQIV
jgi:hypothetical protein